MAWNDLADSVLKTTVGTFKTSAIYIRAAAPMVEIPLSGVFDRPHAAVDPGTRVQVDTIGPSFGIRMADLPADVAAGDTLTIAEIVYKVTGSMEDGQGGTTLSLSRM